MVRNVIVITFLRLKNELARVLVMTLKGNIEINQKPANHTESDEWLVSKETAASRG